MERSVLPPLPITEPANGPGNSSEIDMPHEVMIGFTLAFDDFFASMIHSIRSQASLLSAVDGSRTTEPTFMYSY